MATRYSDNVYATVLFIGSTAFSCGAYIKTITIFYKLALKRPNLTDAVTLRSLYPVRHVITIVLKCLWFYRVVIRPNKRCAWRLSRTTRVRHWQAVSA